MTITRLGHRSTAVVAGAILAAAILATGLGGCTSDSDQAPSNVLTGTRWSGIDSLDRGTSFEFQPDGTVGVTYYDDTFDDELDTWELTGTTVSIEVYQSETAGTATYTGVLDDSTMRLEATTDTSGESWTLTLAKE